MVYKINLKPLQQAEQKLENKNKTLYSAQTGEEKSLNSIYLSMSKNKNLSVGVTFDPALREELRTTLKKHHVRLGKKISGNYQTKNAARQIELVRLALKKGIINKDQRNEILCSIAAAIKN